VSGAAVQHRIPAEGADYLLLAGVNDAHLQELARQWGSRPRTDGRHVVFADITYRVREVG
jgi:hypothetical protein